MTAPSAAAAAEARRPRIRATLLQLGAGAGAHAHAAVAGRSASNWPLTWPYLPRPLLFGAGGLFGPEADSHKAEMQAACACLNWSTVYASHEGMCREGRGLPMATGIQGLQEQMCSDLFQKLNASFCVNRYGGEGSGGQWCYVRKECATYSGFAPGGVERYVGEPLAIKTCTTDRDSLLRQRSPEELLQLARTLGLDERLLARIAYPVQRRSRADIQAFQQLMARARGGHSSTRRPTGPSSPSVWLADDGDDRNLLLVHKQKAWLLGS